MSRTYATIRDPKPNESIPVYIGGREDRIELEPGKEYPCWQPDELDHTEYNLVLIVDGIVVRAVSIDFEFKDY